MAISVVMPALEMAQETGKLISWLKKEGEPVAKGEPLLEIETDKAVMEIESPGDGILAGVNIEAGAEVPVGRPSRGSCVPEKHLPPTKWPPIGQKDDSGCPDSGLRDQPSATQQPRRQSARISPKARRLASERGVDLATSADRGRR